MVGLVGCNVIASHDKLLPADVTDDVTNDDDNVDPVARDIDDVDILSATAAELTSSDVTSVSRDVNTGVKVLRGDVIRADHLSLLLLEVSGSDFVYVVMVTSLLGDADNNIELLTSLLDGSVVALADALPVYSLRYREVNSSLG